MKRFTIILIAMLVCPLSIFSQVISFGTKTVKANDVYVTKQIKIDNFDCLEVAGSMDVVYTQSTGKPGLEIYTSENIINLLDIKVANGTLKIKFKKGYNIKYNKLIIRASSETLHAINLAGSGSIDLSKGLKSSRLHVELAGSGDIIGKKIFCQDDLNISIAGSGEVELQQLACNDLYLNVAGSGDMTLKDVDANITKAEVAGSGCINLFGKSNEAMFEIAGSGDIMASDLVAKKVKVSIAGSGDAECHATDHLKVSIAGSGEVGYKGNPQLDLPKRGIHKL